MSWLTALTGFFTSINPIVAALGGAVGILATYLINRYIAGKQAQAAAETAMDQAMDDHAGDGAQSVADSESAANQIDRLKETLNGMDNANQPKGN